MFRVVLQQPDESERPGDNRLGDRQQGKTPFHVAVQILSCDDQHDNHQEAPKKKEEGKDGLADPEDLQKDLMEAEWC